MAYTHVQFIAYEVPTEIALPAGVVGVGDIEICKAVENDRTFTQAFATLSLDAQVRITRLLAIIDLVRSSKKAKAQDTTLKLFMAPEFYLRPEQGGPSRSYPHTEMVAAQQIFRAVFSQSMLAGWVCVLGTMIWNLKGKVVEDSARTGLKNPTFAEKRYLDSLKLLVDSDLVYNSAMVGVGGKGVWVYDKVHYADPADQIAPENWPLKEYVMHGPMQTIVEAGNVHCGLEVCRDHQQHLLNKGLAALKASFSQEPQSQPKLDLQLLTAAGMPIQKNSVVVGVNAPVFRVDGTVAQSDELFGKFTHSEIQLVAEKNNQGVTKMVNPGTDLDGWTALNTEDSELVLDGDLKLKVDGKEGTVLDNGVASKKALDKCYPQRVVVYPYLALPH